jgi:hypothetical protein
MILHPHHDMDWASRAEDKAATGSSLRWRHP